MDKEFLSKNIATLRKERGWTQEKLAQEAEVSYHTVFRAEAGTKPEHGFGAAGGLSLDSNRAGKKIHANDGSSGSASNTNLIIAAAYVDVIYYLNRYYIKGGANFSVPYLYTEGGSASVSSAGSPGLQMGAGYMLDDKMMLELNYRRLSFNASLKNNGVVANLDAARLEGFQFGFKYLFD